MLALALLLFASVARAEGGAPEGASLTQLNAKLSAAKRARITTMSGVALVSETHATPAGVYFQNLLVWQGADTLRAPGLAAWEEIRGIETEGGSPSRWRKRWPLALAGGVLGLSVFFARGGAASTEHSPLSFFLVGGATGYGVGFVAEKRAWRWRPIYP
jgi:hypothetical protein